MCGVRVSTARESCAAAMTGTSSARASSLSERVILPSSEARFSPKSEAEWSSCR